MADDIAQVIQLEYQGMTLAIKSSIEAAEFILQTLRALGRTLGDARNKHVEKKKQKMKKVKRKMKKKDLSS